MLPTYQVQCIEPWRDEVPSRYLQDEKKKRWKKEREGDFVTRVHPEFSANVKLKWASASDWKIQVALEIPREGEILDDRERKQERHFDREVKPPRRASRPSSKFHRSYTVTRAAEELLLAAWSSACVLRVRSRLKWRSMPLLRRLICQVRQFGSRFSYTTRSNQTHELSTARPIDRDLLLPLAYSILSRCKTSHCFERTDRIVLKAFRKALNPFESSFDTDDRSRMKYYTGHLTHAWESITVAVLQTSFDDLSMNLMMIEERLNEPSGVHNAALMMLRFPNEATQRNRCREILRDFRNDLRYTTLITVDNPWKRNVWKNVQWNEIIIHNSKVIGLNHETSVWNVVGI